MTYTIPVTYNIDGIQNRSYTTKIVNPMLYINHHIQICNIQKQVINKIAQEKQPGHIQERHTTKCSYTNQIEKDTYMIKNMLPEQHIS